MKILHVVHYDAYPRTDLTFVGRAQNGLERWLDSMILNSDNSYQHYVLYFNFYDASISVYRVLKSGKTAEYTNFFGVAYTEEQLQPILEKVLAWFSPQLIHIHYLQPYTKQLPRLLQKLNFKNIVATMHDESFLGENFGLDQRYYYDPQVADFFKNVKKAVFLHDVSMERYVKLYQKVLPPAKRVKIPNGISLKRVARVNGAERPFTVLFLGSFIENKGSNVIAAFDTLAQAKHADLNLYLLGRSLDTSLKQTNITYMGPYNQKNIAEKVATVNPDVIVISSIVEEVFSYTALEATALGYPVVAFNVGALSKIAEEGRGFVVKSKTATALFGEVGELARLKKQDPAAWQKIFNNVKKFPIFSDHDMVEAYEAIYRQFGRKRSTPTDTTALFQQNAKNLKIKEQQFYDAMQAYWATLKQVESFRSQQEQQVELQQNLGGEHKHMLQRGNEYIRKHGGFFKALAQLIALIKLYGFKAVYEKAVHLKDNIDYPEWIRDNELPYTAGEIDALLNNLSYQPKISVLMPVYNVAEEYLRACIESIRAQSYTNWELCIADDASPQPHIKRILTEYMNKDFRIKVVFRKKNGHISAATNAALAIATGEFVAFIDNDDLIEPDAFLEVVKVLNEHPDADFIYSDEDKINADGTKRVAPFFKPDWSPDTLWSHMYVTHLTVFRTRIAREIGGLRVGYEGSQDYDFVLRFVEKTNNIYHIPKILYHWRMIETSAASGNEIKDYAYDAGIRAKRDAIKRRKLDAEIESLPHFVASNIVYHPRATDFVSIIIATQAISKELLACLDSLYQKTTWQHFEVILVGIDRDQVGAKQFAYLKATYANLRMLKLEASDNYSTLNNEAARSAKGNVLLFLHSDTIIMTADWLERMIGQAIQPHSGVVGAKLLNKNNTVQHAGIVIQDQVPVYAFTNLPEKHVGYFGRALLNYNYIAVSGAALMVETSIFAEVGGFDEDFPNIYNDVAFGMLVAAAGYYNSIRNDVKIYHLATNIDTMSSSEEEKTKQMEHARQLLLQKWHKFMENDPFFNRNLTTNGSHFTLKKHVQ